jgi:hypothetical protein
MGGIRIFCRRNDPNEQPVNDVEGIEVLLYPNEQLDSDVETIEIVAV